MSELTNTIEDLYSKFVEHEKRILLLETELKEYMTNDKYEIYYEGAEKDGKCKWFTEYVKFIEPIIFENIEKFKK